MKHRLPALDWMRGIVMVLMVTDHASAAFNANRFAGESVFFLDRSKHIVPMEFWYRWLSHLCAPTFLFLAGTALALSIERKLARGDSARVVDRDLFIRGALLVILDLTFISLVWMPGLWVLQVLYAIGMSMILMILLRRLSTPWLVGSAITFLLLAEVVVEASAGTSGLSGTLLSLFFTAGVRGDLMIGYPVLPWLAIMALGWGFGRYLLALREREQGYESAARFLLIAGALALVVAFAVRAANGYGNMLLTRADSSAIQWGLISKYPPSITFVLCELGIMAVITGSLFSLRARRGDDIAVNNPILVFGQTALFFYLAHIAILELSARALSTYQSADLLTAVVASVLAMVLLYPMCRVYRRLKAAHPTSVLRFI